MWVINKWIIPISLSIFILEVIPTALKFGKFKVRSVHVERCKGPKKLDCCDFSWEIQNETIIHYNFTAYENIAPLKAKITVATNGKGLRLQVNKVCDHVFIKPFMETILNITENCVILKGEYKFSMDIEKVIQNYYGGEFFFGNVTIHAILNNNKCNFSCTILTAIFTPKH